MWIWSHALGKTVILPKVGMCLSWREQIAEYNTWQACGMIRYYLLSIVLEIELSWSVTLMPGYNLPEIDQFQCMEIKSDHECVLLSFM